MGCNCGRRANNLTPDSTFVSRAYPSPGGDDLVVLQSAPECTTPYTGIYRQATIIVVGYSTEAERLFARRERTAALTHAREQNLTFDLVPAGALCDEAVLALLGS